MESIDEPHPVGLVAAPTVEPFLPGSGGHQKSGRRTSGSQRTAPVKARYRRAHVEKIAPSMLTTDLAL